MPQAADASRQSAALRQPPLWLLVLVTFSGTLAMHMFVPALPAAAADLDASVGAMQMTISLYIVGLAVGQLVYGPLSDCFGRRPTLLAGLTLYTAAGLGAALAPGAGSLIAARLLQALGGCAGLALGRAIVRDTTGSHDAVRRLALLNLMTMAGPALAPMSGSTLSATLGWRSIFLALVTLGAVNLLSVWRLLPETGRPSGQLSTRSLLQDYRHLLRSPVFVGFAVGGGCTTTAIYAFIAAAPFLFVHELHRPLHEVGIYLGLLMVGMAAGNVLTGRLIGRVTMERLLVGATLLVLASSLAFLAAELLGLLTVAVAAGTMSLMTLGAGMSSPAALTRAISIDPRLTGSAAGLYGFIQMTVGAGFTALVAAGPDPALAAGLVLALGGLVAQMSFWIAIRAQRA
ncbi:Bcr/CflA family efflux MFS transporter [Geminicoccus harenae]|uniref:Bcr/CflA family efflux MFS transporter n=1 Tax=Geminicoccus harenae TaxID=2498453 RepID=UPI00168AE4E6|nr:Bcr/CflA family efflux MFS transporter [Geminicoccus harenae]